MNKKGIPVPLTELKIKTELKSKEGYMVMMKICSTDSAIKNLITAISFTTDYDFAFRREGLYIVNTASESIKVIALLRADKIRTYNLAEEITIRIAVKELKTLIKNSSEVTFYILKDDSRINGLTSCSNFNLFRIAEPIDPGVIF